MRDLGFDENDPEVMEARRLALDEELLSRARETAEREVVRKSDFILVPSQELADKVNECAALAVSRIPSEEEIAEAIAHQMPGWNDDTSEPELEGARRAAMEAHWERVNRECLSQGRELARVVRELIEKKMLE